MVIHVVQENETVYSIAQYYGVSANRIIFDNQILLPERLVIGQALLILFPEIVHQVAEGESILSIAQSYDTTEREIIRNNPFIITRGFLIEGEYIVIRYQGERIREIQTNGYAYPFINLDLLEETLPFLTSLSIFSYGFTEQGDLVPIDDEPLIELAIQYGVEPLLVLTTLTSEGVFDSDLVGILVSDDNVQQRLIENLLITVREKNYSGVDVDFEFIPAESRDDYSTFVARLTEVMNEEGYTVSVALAPKVSAEQEGLIYEGIDYGALGSAANSVLLMTYEWGYTYGPPLPVAPIQSVRLVLDFAVTQIPRNRIDMGIPNYGYDWALPYIRGVTRADSIGNVEAVQIALENNVRIQYDELEQTPFFEYTRDGIDHIVWFEDVRSIRAKLGLVVEYEFRGVGYWHLMNYFRANWLLVNSLFTIVDV